MKKTKGTHRSRRSATPRDVDAYLAAVPQEARAALERLRRIIRSTVPDADEVISYQMPAFRYRGRGLVCYAAFKDHCSFFPGSRGIGQLAAELRGFKTSKGTIQFTAGKPLPALLIKKLVRARIREMTAHD